MLKKKLSLKFWGGFASATQNNLSGMISTGLPYLATVGTTALFVGELYPCLTGVENLCDLVAEFASISLRDWEKLPLFTL